eukprot:3109204-Pyramimonas_sp.AAC.1
MRHPQKQSRRLTRPCSKTVGRNTDTVALTSIVCRRRMPVSNPTKRCGGSVRDGAGQGPAAL